MKKTFFPSLHFLLTKICIFKRVKWCKNLITIQSNFSHFLGQLAKSFLQSRTLCLKTLGFVLNWMSGTNTNMDQTTNTDDVSWPLLFLSVNVLSFSLQTLASVTSVKVTNSSKHNVAPLSMLHQNCSDVAVNMGQRLIYGVCEYKNL